MHMGKSKLSRALRMGQFATFNQKLNNDNGLWYHFFIILMVGIHEKNNLAKQGDVWPAHWLLINGNVVRYVWDHKNMHFWKTIFKSKTLWKCVTEYPSNQCDKRYNTQVYSGQVSLNNSQYFLMSGQLLVAMTCYVWDVTYGTLCLLLRMHIFLAIKDDNLICLKFDG